LWAKNEATERARAASVSKFETATRLSRVQLEVPDDLSGGMRCRKCGSHDLVMVLRQTRSGDEGMTAFVTCKVCNHTW
jgi:DNA-directed RNA polymerase subunit M/transcription elongation factor TFIIS